MEEGLITTVFSKSKQLWGTKLKMFGLENSREVSNYRCKACGFVETFVK